MFSSVTMSYLKIWAIIFVYININLVHGKKLPDANVLYSNEYCTGFNEENTAPFLTHNVCFKITLPYFPNIQQY